MKIDFTKIKNIKKRYIIGAFALVAAANEGSEATKTDYQQCLEYGQDNLREIHTGIGTSRQGVYTVEISNWFKNDVECSYEPSLKERKTLINAKPL